MDEDTDHHEVLRVVMTEWVAAARPPVSDFVRAEKALARFKELLEAESFAASAELAANRGGA